MIAPAVEERTVPVVVADGAVLWVDGQAYVAGERVEVPAADGLAWCRDGFARPVST